MSLSIAFGPQLFITIKAIITNTNGGIHSIPHVEPEKWALRCEEEIMNGFRMRSQAARQIDKTTTVVLEKSVSSKKTLATTPAIEAETAITDEERRDLEELANVIEIASPKPRRGVLLFPQSGEDTGQEPSLSEEESIIRPSTSPNKLVRTPSKRFSTKELEEINAIVARTLSTKL